VQSPCVGHRLIGSGGQVDDRETTVTEQQPTSFPESGELSHRPAPSGPTMRECVGHPGAAPRVVAVERAENADLIHNIPLPGDPYRIRGADGPAAEPGVSARSDRQDMENAPRRLCA